MLRTRASTRRRARTTRARAAALHRRSTRSPATTVTRATGSFAVDGFATNMRVRLEGAGGGDFVVTDVSDTTLTLGGSPVAGAHTGIIDTAERHAHPHRRLELARQRLPRGPAHQGRRLGPTLFKIESITGSPGKTDVLLITDHPSLRPSDGDRAAVGHAVGSDRHVHAASPGNAPQTCTVATCGNWYIQVTVLLADPFFELAPGRQNLHVPQAAAPAERHPRPAVGRGRHDLRRSLAARRRAAAR